MPKKCRLGCERQCCLCYIARETFMTRINYIMHQFAAISCKIQTTKHLQTLRCLSTYVNTLQYSFSQCLSSKSPFSAPLALNNSSTLSCLFILCAAPVATTSTTVRTGRLACSATNGCMSMVLTALVATPRGTTRLTLFFNATIKKKTPSNSSMPT